MSRVLNEITHITDLFLDIGVVFYDYINRNNNKPVERLIKKYHLMWTMGANSFFSDNKITDGFNTIIILDDQTISLSGGRERIIVSGRRVESFLNIVRGVDGINVN